MRERTPAERRKLSAARSLAAHRAIEQMHRDALEWCRKQWEANNRLPDHERPRIWAGMEP